MTSITVSGLTPARTYQFRVCAVNQVGKGQYSRETSRLMLPEEPPSAPPKNIVASGRTNQSIMVQWQPPPESEHNGVLHGYVLRCAVFMGTVCFPKANGGENSAVRDKQKEQQAAQNLLVYGGGGFS
ncbi:UNVERIFIED_CONTAM: Protein sidekick-1 [Gekko kuhli]